MGKKNKFVKIREKGIKGEKGLKQERVRFALWQKLALLALGLLTVFLSLNTLNIFLADVSFNLGESSARYGFYTEAISHYRDAVFLNSREPRYHRELAWALAANGDTEGAVKEAETAYRLNPQNSLTLRSIIPTYKTLAKSDPRHQKRAEELIQEAIDRQPTNPALYLERAKILFDMDKTTEAKKSLGEALELKPDHQEAKELLQTLQ